MKNRVFLKLYVAPQLNSHKPTVTLMLMWRLSASWLPATCRNHFIFYGCNTCCYAVNVSKPTMCAQCSSVERSIVYRHLVWCSCLTVCWCGTSTQMFATLDFSWLGTNIFTQNENTKSLFFSDGGWFSSSRVSVAILCRSQCEELKSEHFTCVLFTSFCTHTHPVCKGLPQFWELSEYMWTWSKIGTDGAFH